jgi:hypothetical protein
MLKMAWTLNEHGRLIAHWQVCPSDQKLQPLLLAHRSIPTIEYRCVFSTETSGSASDCTDIVRGNHRQETVALAT